MQIFKAAITTLLLCLCSYQVALASNFDRSLFFIPKDAPPDTWELMKKAASLASKNPHCVSIIGGAWTTKAESTNSGNDNPNDQFYVQCQSDQLGPVPGIPAYFNLYYSYQDLRNNAIKHRPTPVSDKDAIAECKQAILDRLQYPSSAHMDLVRSGANGTDNNWVVYYFTALNGFGNRVPQKGSCIIDPSNHIDVSITNR